MVCVECVVCVVCVVCMVCLYLGCNPIQGRRTATLAAIGMTM